MRLFSLTLVLASLLSVTAFAQRAEVSLSASQSRVRVGEPFAVEVRASIDGGDAEDISLPDFGKLEVLGHRSARPFTFSFGIGGGGQHAVMQSQIVHTFTLRAREAGVYKIPAAVVVVNGHKFKSQPLAIEASGEPYTGPTASAPRGPQGLSGIPGMPNFPGLSGFPGAPPDEPDPDQASDNLSAPPSGPLDGATYDNDVFLRTVVDRKQPYVGEQTTVTVYLYMRGRLQQTPTVTREPTTEGFWVQDLLPLERNRAPIVQTLNGRPFNVYVLRRFAAFPLREGELKIGAPRIEVGGGSSLFDLLNGPAAPTQRNGVEIAIRARAVPKAPQGEITHVGDLTLDAKIEPSKARVGDALTLEVTAKGTGNLKALALGTPTLEGAEVLSPEVDDELTMDLDQVGGTRTFRWLILPRTPGALTIPAFRVAAFNPEKGAYQTVESARLTVPVTGTALPVANAPDPAKAGSEEAPHFGPARRQSALLRRKEPLDRAAWYPFALALAPLAFVVLLGARFTRRALASRAESSTGSRKFKEAQAKLDEARSAAERGDTQQALAALATALKRALEARLEEPVGGLTRGALRNHLTGRGMSSPLAERIVSQLEDAEEARFDPTPKTQSELATEIEKARGVLRELERFTPKEAA